MGQKSEARRSRKPKAEKPKPEAGPVTPAEVWVPRVVRKAKSLHEAKPTERPARKAREPKPLSAAKLSKVGNPTKQPRAKTGAAPKGGPKSKSSPKAGPKSAMKPGAAKKAPNRGARKPR